MVTAVLTVMMCVILFVMIWAATYFYPWERLLDFFPQDVKEKAKLHRPPFPAAPVIGWVVMILCILGFIGVIIYSGMDGIRKGFTFRQFLIRYLIMLYGLKDFDIIGLDYFLMTKTQFFQHYIPETKGCSGYHSFGYNRGEQIKRLILMPFAAALTAWICTLF